MDWLRDTAKEIVEAAEGDPGKVLGELRAYARERERMLKKESENPPSGHTFQGLYGMGMATEYMAVLIEAVMVELGLAEDSEE